jgi:hypothetical protein
LDYSRVTRDDARSLALERAVLAELGDEAWREFLRIGPNLEAGHRDMALSLTVPWAKKEKSEAGVSESDLKRIYDETIAEYKNGTKG